jgi:hypothetical protein
MKTLFGILFVIVASTAFAQFPPPTNFQFSYEYIMINQSGECAGQWLYGPTYCSHFAWDAPNANLTTATLENYKLYYFDFFTQDTILLASPVETFFDMEIGIIGEIWVTAVYGNPDGESAPSEILVNHDLPISIDENPESKNMVVYYDNGSQVVNIESGETISEINIYDVQGQLVQSQQSAKSSVNFAHQPRGLYVIEITFGNREVVRRKIIK